VYKEVAVDPFLTKGMAVFTFEHPETNASVPNLFDAMTTAQSGSDHDARGMKLTTATDTLAQFFVEGVQTHLPDVRIILLNRRDTVSQFGSLIKSQETGVWRRRAGDEKTESTPELELDRHDFAQYAIETYQIKKKLHGLKDTHDVLEISYEDILLEGELPTYEPVFNFVGVEPKRADWLEDRKLSPPPESYIKNYSDLSKMHDQIERRLEKGQAPDSLYDDYERPLRRKLRRKATFWGRRPGYAVYRVEQRIRDFFGLGKVDEVGT
jgi:hypothetical protein